MGERVALARIVGLQQFHSETNRGEGVTVTPLSAGTYSRRRASYFPGRQYSSRAPSGPEPGLTPGPAQPPTEPDLLPGRWRWWRAAAVARVRGADILRTEWIAGLIGSVAAGPD